MKCSVPNTSKLISSLYSFHSFCEIKLTKNFGKNYGTFPNSDFDVKSLSSNINASHITSIELSIQKDLFRLKKNDNDIII